MGSEQAREAADGLFDKILSNVGIYAEFLYPSYREAAVQDLAAALTTAREQALREAAEIADRHARHAWADAEAEGQNEVCASGRNHGARAIHAAILSLLTKEPKA